MNIRNWFLCLMLASPLSAWSQGNPLKSPNVSANALFLYRNSNFHQEDVDTTRNGLDVQEAEVMYYSDVDPYSRLTMVLSFHPEYTPAPATAPTRVSNPGWW